MNHLRKNFLHFKHQNLNMHFHHSLHKIINQLINLLIPHFYPFNKMENLNIHQLISIIFLMDKNLENHSFKDHLKTHTSQSIF